MTISIETESMIYWDVLNDSIQSFPLTEEDPIVRHSSAAEFQCAGPFDNLFVTLDPILVKLLLGVGVVIAGAAAKKISELAAQDFYDWFKERCFAKACKQFVEISMPIPYLEPKHGVRVYVFSDDEKDINVIFHVVYSHLGKEPYDERLIINEFHAYENVVRPVIIYMASHIPIRFIIVQGWIGLGSEDTPRWLLYVEGDDEGYDFPSIMSDGFIDWEHKCRGAHVLKEMLNASPPFSSALSSGLFHWRSCVKVSHLDPSEVKGVIDHEDGLGKGLQPCALCITKSRPT